MQRLIRRCEGIACRILIQHERLEQVNTFPYLGSLITEEQTDFNLDKTNERALVWPVATYGCESWTPTKNEESRLDAFEMKRLRKILRVSCSAKKTNDLFYEAGVKRELLDTVKATMGKQGSCFEKETMQRTTPSAHRRGRPHTAWVDNIKTWTGLPVEESVRMTEDRDK